MPCESLRTAVGRRPAAASSRTAGFGSLHKRTHKSQVRTKQCSTQMRAPAPSEREHGGGELRLGEPRQKIGLVLLSVRAEHQRRRAALRALHPRVVARRHAVELAAVFLSHVLQKSPKLDAAVAQHVRVWGAPRRDLAQAVRHHALPVLARERHHLERHARLVADGARIG